MLKLKSLYDVDFNLWVEAQVLALKSERLEDLDLPNLIEEIEYLARKDKKALRSYLEVLLMHLLKWQFQPSKRSKSWKVSVTRARLEIEDIFEDSPSLKNYLPTVVNRVYARARTVAEQETELNITTFPADCPYTLEQALNVDFWPNG
ncbi:MAG: DUF29 domain-containing protein [Cyanobacteria bacterium J06614_10]